MKRFLLFTTFILSLVGFSSAYAFPENSVLDAFTGTDTTTPPNSNWTNAELADGGNGGGCVLHDNAVTVANDNGIWSCYWDTTSFNADQEAFFTIVDTANSTFVDVACRIANPGNTTSDGYFVRETDGTSTVGIYRLDNGIPTQLGSDITQALDTGDRIGILCVGTTISSWFSDDGGTWTQLDSQTDATYSAGGFIGAGSNATTTIGAWDNFGGGNVTTSQRRGSYPIFLN